MKRFVAILIVLIASSCGSGHTDSTQDVEIIHWTQRPLFTDCTVLDLRMDILCYEIHASDNCDWSDNTSIAAVSSVDSIGDPVNAFNIGILRLDNTTFFTVRSIGIDNAESEFGEPIFREGK